MGGVINFTFPMRCEDPQLIRNKYTGVWMYVPCRHCDMCLMEQANLKSSLLGVNMLNSEYNIFVTFTYDNWNVPFIIDGYTGIHRLAFDGTIDTVEETDEVFCADNCVSLKKFPLRLSCKVVGVLYYRDFQLFLKRIRKKLFKIYGKYQKFDFFVSGEYGTIYQRPHFHAIFGFSSSQLKSDFERLLPMCWSFCDWSRFRNAVENAEPGAASYVSSYVNNFVGYCGLLSTKRFKPFTKRSACSSFGSKDDDVSQVETIIKREYGKEVFGFVREDFIRRESGKSADSSFTLRLISTHLFDRYFTRPKGFSNLSFNDFFLLCSRIYRLFQEFRHFGHTKYDLRPFLGFMRSYYRFCLKFNILDSYENFTYYLYFLYHLWSFIKSCQLYLQMSAYDPLSPLEYIYAQYNTFTWEHVNSEQLYNIYSQFGLSDLVLSGFYSPSCLAANKQYRIQYHKKLLPKHLNDYYESF